MFEAAALGCAVLLLLQATPFTENESGHAAGIELLPWQKLAATNEIPTRNANVSEPHSRNVNMSERALHKEYKCERASQP